METIPDNCLRQARQAAGLSQEELADRANIARQTVGGIETGRYNPSLAVAFRIARVLCKSVEDIFRMPDYPPEDIFVDWCDIYAAPDQGAQVYVGRPAATGGYIAYPVNLDSLYNDYNAIIRYKENNRLLARMIDPVGAQPSSALIAGCSPALAFFKKRITGRYRDLNIHWINTNSMAALRSLSQGYVHIAGVHIFDEATGEYNLPIVKKVLGKRKHLVINLCYGEQGLLTAPGNPKGIHTFADLSGKGVRLVNREPGAETRRLLDSGLQKAGVMPEAVEGYKFQARGHMEVAQAVALGGADCGISLRPLANTYHLDFIPLARERYDLIILQENVAAPGVQAVLDCLCSHSFHLDLEASGYSPEECGKEITSIA